MIILTFKCLRSSLYALNIVYIIVGLLLIMIGAYARLAALVASIEICGGIIACGVFLILVASLGVFAASKHNQIALFFYVAILFLLFLVQFSIACACLAMNEKMERILIKKGWDSSTTARKYVTKTFDCCGLFSNENVNLTNIDCQSLVCCSSVIGRQTLCCSASQPVRYNECPCPVCWGKLSKNLDPALKVTGGVALFFSFTEIIGVWLAIRYRNTRNPIIDLNSFL